MMKYMSIWCVFTMLVCAACSDSSDDSTPSSDENGTDSDNGTETVPEYNPDYVSTEEMLERSLLSVGNNVRVKAALDKVANGEEVTIAYIGGSITLGYSDEPEDSYVAGSYEAFKARFATGDADNIHYVNAGMGGTPSSLGMLRYDRDVLAPAPTSPDIVFVEFAVNDGDDPTNGIAYESLVRRILLSENKPAVVLVFCVFKDHWNLEDRLVPVGEHYQLPMISIKSAVVPELEAGNITHEEFFRDDYHPTSYGFKIMAETIDHYFATVAAAPTDSEDITIPDDAEIGAQFTDILPIDPNTELVAGELEIDPGSFNEIDNAIPTYEGSLGKSTFPTNWHKKTADSNDPFTLTVTCKNLVLAYKQSKYSNFGTAEAYLDGELVETIPGGGIESAWNNPWTLVLLDEETAAPHTLEIRMADDSADKRFTILAFGYTP